MAVMNKHGNTKELERGQGKVIKSHAEKEGEGDDKGMNEE